MSLFFRCDLLQKPRGLFCSPGPSWGGVQQANLKTGVGIPGICSEGVSNLPILPLPRPLCRELLNQKKPSWFEERNLY